MLSSTRGVVIFDPCEFKAFEIIENFIAHLNLCWISLWTYLSKLKKKVESKQFIEEARVSWRKSHKHFMKLVNFKLRLIYHKYNLYLSYSLLIDSWLDKICLYICCFFLVCNKNFNFLRVFNIINICLSFSLYTIISLIFFNKFYLFV